MDFLDGSDVDEDNVGDVDQDVENVLLGSDDEEAHSSHQASKFSTSSFTSRKIAGDDRGHHSEEEEDVLNIMLQGEEEPLDFEGDGSHAPERVVKLRGTFRRESSLVENDNMPNTCNYDTEEGLNEDNFQGRRYVEDDEYDDDDTETRTRSRFTTERNVESYSGGAVASNSVGIPIQTVGERKIRPGVPDIRPKHWNHNGPRPNGPRFLGRNHHHRYPNPGRPPMEGQHMRPNMHHQPIMQFNDGIFTDFGQPMRHPRPRQLLPGRLEPRNLEHHQHPMRPQMPNNNRQPMPSQNNRPPFYPERPQNMAPPRMHPGGGDPMHMQLPHQIRPDFNMRPQRARFPPNMNANNRNAPPHLNHMSGPGHPQERMPFVPRHQRPPFRQDFGPSQPPPPGMLPPRHPNAAGFAPPHQPPHGGPPNFVPQNPYPPPGNQGQVQFRMGMPQQVPPGPCESAPFYSQQPGVSPNNFNQPRSDPAYPHDAGWGGMNEQMPSQMHGGNSWIQHNQQPQQQNYNAPGYGNSPLYEHTHQPVPVVHHNMVAHHPQLSVAIQSAHSLDVPSAPITKSIYIKPNSEIHEALSKGHFLPPKSEPRHDSSGSSHYDRDRERSSSRRGGSPSSERRRSDDDYYDERKSYHHDRRPRRKYEESRRHHSRSRSRSRSRSPSPERKYIRTERPFDRDRNRRRERDDVDHKESGKLLEEAKKMGLGEDYVKKLEEQRRLREKILKTKEQRRKLVKVAGAEVDNSSSPEKDTKTIKRTVNNTAGTASSTSKGSSDTAKEIEADSTVATSKGGGKPKKILRIVRDKSGKIISKKVHVVLMGKPQQEGQQQSSAS